MREQAAQASAPDYEGREGEEELDSHPDSGPIPTTEPRTRFTTSGINELQNRVPQAYTKARRWLPHVLLAAAIAILSRGAPIWVIAFAVIALLIQFIPDRQPTHQS